MPEMHFIARWPDDTVDAYYSPSVVVAEYLEPGRAYALSEFVERSRTALRIASERVRVRYGFACSRAASTLNQIERKARDFSNQPTATVRVEAYRE